MNENLLPCEGHDKTIYIGWENEKPSWEFTFELITWGDWYCRAYPDNQLCETCKYAIECISVLVRELCEQEWTEIVEELRTQ